MKNVEKADRVHLGSLIESLKKGHYVIPDFQREFEWQPWDVRDLIQSIFMDYYIGTLLLWKGSKHNFNSLSCQPIYAFDGVSDPQHIVLDGQQRLTAIHYAFFGPSVPFPNRTNAVVFTLEINEFLDEDYENAFKYRRLTQKLKHRLDHIEEQYEHHMFPLQVMKEGTWGTSEWIMGYRDYWKGRSDETEVETEKHKYLEYSNNAANFRSLIEEMFNQYYISYIELDRDIELGKVCDIFTQINSKGVRLDIFDLLNAILRPKDIYLKKMWHDAEEILSYTDSKKMKIYVLQVMSTLEQSYCSSKYLYFLVPESIKRIRHNDGSQEEKVLVPSSEDFMRRWNEAVNAIENAIKSLKNPRDYGAISPTFVPYPSIIPAFASIRRYVETSNLSNKIDIQGKIRKWYWASVFLNNYSSSVETTSAKDFQDLKQWFLDDEQEPESIMEFNTKFRQLNLVNDHPKGSAIYNAIFNLLIINEARDWETFELPEYDGLDDHHIVPRSVFRDIAGPSINSILNRTPLSPNTNRNIIRNRMPNEYLAEMLANNDPNQVYQVLESHLISKKAVEILLRNPFEKEDFEEFLQVRQQTILDGIENRLIKQKVELPPMLRELDEEIEKIELAIRALIVSKSGDTIESYLSTSPSHLQPKIEDRIQKEMKKDPTLEGASFGSFSSRLQFFDMREYQALITSKPNWPEYESTFGKKEMLTIRFDQLCNLRNSIRHSRDISDFGRLDGEASIRWFKQILGLN